MAADKAFSLTLGSRQGFLPHLAAGRDSSPTLGSSKTSLLAVGCAFYLTPCCRWGSLALSW
jgi:hypothetical protein